MEKQSSQTRNLFVMGRTKATPVERVTARTQSIRRRRSRGVATCAQTCGSGHTCSRVCGGMSCSRCLSAAGSKRSPEGTRHVMTPYPTAWSAIVRAPDSASRWASPLASLIPSDESSDEASGCVATAWALGATAAGAAAREARRSASSPATHSHQFASFRISSHHFSAETRRLVALAGAGAAPPRGLASR